MSGEQSIWQFVNQYVTQIVFMIGIVFAAAKWIDKKNRENVSSLRHELVGDKDHIGLIPRLEVSFAKNIEQVQKDFNTSLGFAERERIRLEEEIDRLRDQGEAERLRRRGKSVRYDAWGEPKR